MVSKPMSYFEGSFLSWASSACALRQDIALLPDGDLTEVGEKGITLSVSRQQTSVVSVV